MKLTETQNICNPLWYTYSQSFIENKTFKNKRIENVKFL